MASKLGFLTRKFQILVNSHDYSKTMIKFRSKVQFQILLQFYRTAEKVAKLSL